MYGVNMKSDIKRVMLIYPSGRSFQRGEERCQIDINYSLVNCNRACNDLGYVAACLKDDNYKVFLKDYQGENLSEEKFTEDLKEYNPDVVFISVTNGSIYEDLKTAKAVKTINKKAIVIFKGALFFNPEKDLLNKLDLSCVDYLIGVEAEFIIKDLLDAHFNDNNMLKNIQGIAYKQNDDWIIQNIEKFNEKLDELPFPDRSLMNNKLYINPDTNREMAVISVARGCCYNCTYCLSPVIGGKKIRFRSAQNIFDEIKECIEKYNIRDFFFKSDTFTTDKQRVLELCKLIVDSGINRSINWVATSRVDTLDEELICAMKNAGCSVLGIGFESGSQNSLDKMKKNTTLEQNLKAAELCRKYKIKILGYFLIGFAWENEDNLKETEKHIFEVDADYIEISIVVPYYKTPIYKELYSETSQNPDILGHDSHHIVVENRAGIPSAILTKYRKKLIYKYYLRPKYIIRQLKTITSLSVLKNYVCYGLRLLKNLIC